MKTEFKDLSTWLKVAIVWTYIQLGASALMLLIWAIIGLTFLS